MRRGLLMALCGLLASPAAAQCRQALALGLDVSGSVDAGEYRQQLDGLAAALEDADVRAALFAMPDAPVDIAVFEWSGPSYARLIQGWITVRDDTALAALAGRLRHNARAASDPSTAIGSAMRFGAGLLAARSACWRAVLDLSGDGASNTGPRPRDIRKELPGITVNGLAIVAPAGTTGQAGAQGLAAYYRAEVIAGPDAFVEEARGFAEYREAIRRKLLRELRVLAVADGPSRSGQ